MIDQVLNRTFVLQQAQAVNARLAELARPRAGEEEAAPDEKFSGALRQLSGALAAEHAAVPSRGDRDVEESPAVVDPRAHRAWIPRDMTLSILQTVLEEQIHERPALLEDAANVDDTGPIATHAVKRSGDEDVGDFTTDDPNWITLIAKAVAERLWRGRHPFVKSDSPPVAKLAAKARIILIGDWGTGGANAVQVADIARQELADAGDAETHVIHLGDVYYAGEGWESQKRFLDRWPVHADQGDQHNSWALMGNHDMYAGGYGFFDTILKDERFRGQRLADGQGISYFGLANEHWQILGLDTAWDDHLITHQGHDGFLHDPQGKWVAERVEAGRGAGCKTMLLSHHQFYSTHQKKVKGDLREKLGSAFAAGGIDAWFWGHEHRAEVFVPRDEVRFAACVGHGAMPEPTGGGQPEDGGWEYDEGGPETDGHSWRWCGLAVLDLDGPDIAWRLVSQQVGEIKRGTLPVS